MLADIPSVIPTRYFILFLSVILLTFDFFFLWIFPKTTGPLKKFCLLQSHYFPHSLRDICYRYLAKVIADWAAAQPPHLQAKRTVFHL